MSTLSTTEGVSRRLRDLTESATMAITAKAKALRAAGSDVIGFGAGEPDFPTPAHIVAAAQAACADEAMHHYSAAAGLPALREAIARKTARDSGIEVSPEEIVVANGGKHALYNAFQALVDPGDEVLLPAPYWVSYPEQIRLAQGVPVVLPTSVDADYQVRVEQLEAARTPRTKALLFCSPSNPSGTVYEPADVEAIGRWAAEHGIWVITDEIYEHLVYGDSRFVSMPAVVPELADRCVIVNGVAKTYAMTGWRVGWTIAPVGLTRAIVKLQSHLSSNVSGVAQAAALAAVDGPMDAVATMRTVYDRRRRLAHAKLDAIPGVRCPLPGGAFYVLPSFEDLLGRPLGGRTVTSSLDLCDALLDVAKVALVPGEGFGAPGTARLSYALADDDLARGLDRIVDALSGS
jgi:aspartate/methionine/tyrosine aminotransferase